MPTKTPAHEIVDPCRKCNGKGTVAEPTDRGTEIDADCFVCRGSGSRVSISGGPA